MNIVDLTVEHENLYFVCLEDWSDEMKEAGDHKQNWYAAMRDKGLRVKLALDDSGQVGGMIQYVPVEHSFIEGQDLYFIHCIWVHGYKRGRGNFQKKGLGTALLQAAETDARDRGARGIAAWGISMPFWMKASWFRKRGYTRVDKQGMQVLLWKPFTDDAVPPKWIEPKAPPEPVPGQVTVTAFMNGWCPSQNIVCERARRAATGFGDKVAFRLIDTFDRQAVRKWGQADALFIDGKQVRTGPPPAYDKIRKLIARRVKRL
ncbi:MAG: GNAT family N-acetyltransferase [Candidatus Neomarinimicrobiota bacterium]